MYTRNVTLYSNDVPFKVSLEDDDSVEIPMVSLDWDKPVTLNVRLSVPCGGDGLWIDPLEPTSEFNDIFSNNYLFKETFQSLVELTKYCDNLIEYVSGSLYIAFDTLNEGDRFKDVIKAKLASSINLNGHTCGTDLLERFDNLTFASKLKSDSLCLWVNLDISNIEGFNSIEPTVKPTDINHNENAFVLYYEVPSNLNWDVLSIVDDIVEDLFRVLVNSTLFSRGVKIPDAKSRLESKRVEDAITSVIDSSLLRRDSRLELGVYGIANLVGLDDNSNIESYLIRFTVSNDFLVEGNLNIEPEDVSIRGGVTELYYSLNFKAHEDDIKIEMGALIFNLLNALDLSKKRSINTLFGL